MKNQFGPKTDAVQKVIHRLAHDLGAPLRHTYGFTSLLLKNYQDQLGEDAQGWLAHISESTEKTQKMLAGLSMYGDVFNCSQSADVSPLAEVWEGVLAEHAALIEQKQAVIEVRGLPVMDVVYRHWNMLLSALLKNSLVYQPNGQKPYVRLDWLFCEHNNLNLNVQDNGIGVEKKFHSELTGIFRRFDFEEKHPDGMGMGLALCERVLEYYKGNIVFGDSDLGGLSVNCIVPKGKLVLY